MMGVEEKVKINLESDNEELPFSSSPAVRKMRTLDFESAPMGSGADVAKSWIYKQSRGSVLRSIYIVLIKAKINILLTFWPFGYIAALCYWKARTGLLLKLSGHHTLGRAPWLCN